MPSKTNLASRLSRSCLAILLATTVVGTAQAANKKVTLAVGTTVLNIGYPMLTLPASLGYWKQEGYDVDVQPVGASLQAIQQVVAGNAEFGEVNSSTIVQSVADNDLPLKIVEANGVIDWAVAVDAKSGIKSAQDLKGKTIGVFSLATGGIPFLKSYLRNAGLDPDKDVSLVPLGLGAAPVQALKTGQVQGLLYWAAALASFENAGLQLDQLRGADWRTYPDYSLTTTSRTIAKDPDMVIAISRGIAKATVFALANPDCALKLHWKYYPSTKPTGADEATLAKWDMNNLKAQLDSLADGYKINGGKYYGAVDPATFDKLQDFMVQAKLVSKKVPVEKYLVDIPDFYKKVNDFDADAVRRQAMECKFD